MWASNFEGKRAEPGEGGGGPGEVTQLSALSTQATQLSVPVPVPNERVESQGRGEADEGR